MPNPFPGINPLIEAQNYWADFRITFLNSLQDAIGDRLPDAYEARLDERFQPFSGDLAALVHQPGRAARAGAALLEPETIPTLIADDERIPFLKILHRPDRTLVTIVELLSPANKTEPDRRDYIARRNAILRQPVHLVELDFLKAGHRLPLRRAPRPADAYALVGRHETRPDSLVYSWTLRDPLPVLPIPLLAPDPDLPIPLADVYATAFERGRYARSIDPAQPLPSPWTDDDRSWAAANL